MMDRDVKKIQKVLLDSAKKIVSILEKNNIDYMLSYGTLLGAIRHKGFIPWDDDFDLYLFEESYDDAIRALRRELPSDLFVEDESSEPLYFHAWAHIKDLNSEVECNEFPQDNLYAHKGISIDLYKVTKVEKCNLYRWLNDENEKYIEIRKAKNIISDEEYSYRKANLAKNRLTENDCDRSDKHFVYGMINVYNCKYMEERQIFPLKKVPFEDTEFYVPNKADEILSALYGDYMTLPPKDKRCHHYSNVKYT